MSTAAVEVIPLEEAGLESAPPCGANTRWRRFVLFGRWMPYRRCSKPATHRVKVTCPVHGTALRFLCRYHLNALKLNVVTCKSCDDRETVRFGGYS